MSSFKSLRTALTEQQIALKMSDRYLNNDMEGWKSWQKPQADEHCGPQGSILRPAELFPHDQDDGDNSEDSNDDHIGQFRVELERRDEGGY